MQSTLLTVRIPILLFISALANCIPDFNVTEYAGTKSILISTRTALGGKNSFMGIAYIVVGGICVLLGALFTVAHLVRPRYEPLLSAISFGAVTTN